MAAPPSSTTVISSASSLADSLFQRSLDDLIKSLRSDPSSESVIISRAISEIHREIRSTDPLTKSIALQKLTYLSSLYFTSMSWAAFHTIELLPSSSLHTKRLAYLAASLSIHPSTTDLITLSTHQLHKDLTSLSNSSSSSPFLPSLPLQLLSLAASPDLSTHLAPDLVPLLSRPSPLQPKAVSAAYRVLSLCPSTVPVLFKPLVDCLSSDNPLTVSAAVGAFCELSAPPNDPSPYLPLAPEIYRVLVNSRSNWTLIKVLKIFSRLVPLEPRLGSRVVEPICQFLRESQAKSLVLECVKTVVTCLPTHTEAIQLAIGKIKELLSADDDPNLRYLGLQTLRMLAPQHLWALEENREVVAQSLIDPDRSISCEALRLMMAMTLQGNSVEICTLLVKQAAKSDPEFANEILDSVLTSCAKDFYELVVDFDWYVSLLGEMARIPHCMKGDEISRQLVDIGLRVRDARPELVRVARELLIDPSLLGNHFLYTVLSAAAWISGEYVEFSKDPMELVEALLQPRTSLLPTSARAVYIQSVLKVLTFSCNSYLEESGSAVNNTVITRMLSLIEMTVGPLAESDEAEVEDRVRNLLGAVRLVGNIKDHSGDKDKDGMIYEVVKGMVHLFSDEMGPVSTNAQKRVAVPDDLDLKENLADLSEFISDDDVDNATQFRSKDSILLYPRNHNASEEVELGPTRLAESTSLEEHRKRHGLYYLSSDKEARESELTEDYPLVNEKLLPLNGDTARRVKVTKPRPTVVKLDEGEDLKTSSSLSNKEEAKDDALSGAIMDALLGKNGEGPASAFDASSSRQGTSKDKEREIKSKKSEEGESKNRHKGKRRHRHRKEPEPGVSASQEKPVIQDFLL
ncbi:AP-3 complex subunit delta-like protein [Carex littledalei]|uniref:AP-3 complex subunit delta n=1 Tax=Carex littledalei TaxID=544730 RepID=A0A833VXI2_9POAL|nr:AP-3 complex subunit delta-like protein [Carex littledalei]